MGISEKLKMMATSPILSVCQALADKLELSDTEKTQFLEHAFLERIKSDAEFLNISLSSKSALPQVQPITFEGTSLSAPI